jgi:hypothetical protein
MPPTAESSGGSIQNKGSWKLNARKRKEKEDDEMGESPVEKEATEVKPLGQARARLTKTEEKKDELKNALSNKDIAAMVNLMLKLCLSTAQMLRDVVGCLWETYLIDENEAILETQHTGKQIPTLMAQAKKDGTKPAPPHIQKFEAFLEAMAEEQEITDDANLIGAINDIIGKIEKMDVDEVNDMIPYFLLKPSYTDPKRPRTTTQYRLSFFLKPKNAFEKYGPGELELQQVMSMAMMKMGAEKRSGCPPPQTLERVAQQFLKDHWNQGRQRKN